MKENHKRFFLGALLGLLISALIFGNTTLRGQSQGGPFPPGSTPVTQTATRADAAINCQDTAASAGVLTFSAQPGLTFYLTEFDLSNTEDATGPAIGAVQTVSTSNIPGGIAWTTPNGPATTPGINVQTFQVIYPTGLKSTVAGTATTITNATTVSHEVVRIHACGFYA